MCLLLRLVVATIKALHLLCDCMLSSVVGEDVMCVRFKTRVSLFTGRATVHLSNRAEGSSVHPYDFYCAAWMGGNNPHIDIQRLKGSPDGTGEASVVMKLLSTDSDMFQMGVYVFDDEIGIVRHLASGFESLGWLGDALEEASSFGESKRSLLLKDNYSKNQALLHFCNDSTDVKAFKVLSQRLSPSVLHNNEEINRKVLALSFGVHNWIEHSANVSSRNGGQNFVNPVCFTEAMGCVINYPLLNLTYTSDRHRAPLPMLAYMGVSTMHYVGMSMERLMKLNNADFISRFVLPLCTSFTVCPKSSVYSGDKTMSAEGGLDCMTENFAMVLSAHLFIGLKSRTLFTDRFSGALASMSLEDLVTHFNALRDNPDPNSKGHPTIADDCETQTGLIKSVEGSIYHHYLMAVAKHTNNVDVIGADVSCKDDPAGHDKALGHMMWEATRGMANLSAVPLQDFLSLGQLLGRYGRLRHNSVTGVSPCAQIGLCIVSAKGPKFSTTNSELNGHACAVAQTLSSEGEASYTIGEGTSNMCMRNPPLTCQKTATLPLTTGDKSFDIMEALGIIAESMGDLTSTCGVTRVGQFIPSSFEGTDPYVSCPFYMAGFFMGLEMNSCTPGVIPLDTRRGVGLVGSEAAGNPPPGVSVQCPPVFGAPVAALADETVRALPINLAEAMGKEEALKFLGQVKTRNDQTYPPQILLEDVQKLMAPWGPLLAFDGATAAKFDPEHTWISSCAEAFDDADVLRTVYEYKRRLADKFNAIQSKDAGDDGVRMTVRCHMLSAVSHFHIPLPTKEKWTLSCARNMKVALGELPSLKRKTSVISTCFPRAIV